jgi:transporter family-2 protein
MAHIAGLIPTLIVILVKRDRPFADRQKLILYFGGAIGIWIVIIYNYAFGFLSVSSILALCLLGQSVTSLFVDRFGLWGMPKLPFYKGKFLGLLFIILGIAVMTNLFNLLASGSRFCFRIHHGICPDS